MYIEGRQTLEIIISSRCTYWIEITWTYIKYNTQKGPTKNEKPKHTYNQSILTKNNCWLHLDVLGSIHSIIYK